jgi:uncharacterized protein involved in type VI secretion and phage assembly
MNLMIPDGPKKRYTGHYPGQVVSVADPDQLMRARVRVFPVFQDIADADLPWAEYLLPVGARAGNGIFIPVKVGDWVWVDFPYLGDSRRPRIVGSIHHCPGSVPNLAPDAFGQSYSHQRTGDEPAPTPPAYHDGSIVLDQNGVLLEIGADSAIRVTNKASGSAIEICSDGKITIHGSSEINISAGNDTNIVVGGNATLSCANANLTASASATIQAPAINLRGPVSAASVSGGHGTMSIDADMTINGNISAQGNISATGTITDTTGNTNHHTH